MNFDKESQSEEIFFFWGGWGRDRERERERERGGVVEQEGDSNRTKPQKTIGIRLFFVLMFYIKFQVPGSSGSLVLPQTKGVTGR